MANSCSIKAHCRNAKGEVVESKLFNDCLHYTLNNRELTKQYYAVGTSEDFLSLVRESPEFHTDENGLITLSSLRNLALIDFEMDSLLKVLNRDIKEGDYPYDTAIEKIQEFNQSNEFKDKVLATLTPTDNNSYHVSVVPKIKVVLNEKGREEKVDNTLEEQQKLHKTVRDAEMERRIINLLKQHGVSARFLENPQPGGRYSTKDVSKAEDGLWGLIEVNNSGKVTDVLAEEAGHFAIGALGDNPLVLRIENLLKDQSVLEQVLGSEEYHTAQLGNNPAREVAGRLVGKALQKQLEERGPIYTLAHRIANLAKRIFHTITGNDVRYNAAKAEQYADKIAYGFIHNNDDYSVDKALSYLEILHDASLSTTLVYFKDAIDSLGRMCKELEAICSDTFEHKIEASLGEAMLAAHDTSSGLSTLLMNGNVFADSFAFDGIVQTFVLIYDYLGPGKEIDTMLLAVDFTNQKDFYANMAKNGRRLRQVRVFYNNAARALKVIENAINDNKIALPNGTTLQDVKYQDINGVWHTVNMTDATQKCRLILNALERTLNNKEATYFARFCEDIYGKKYIDASVGKLWSNITGNNTKEQGPVSIEDLVRGAEDSVTDIDVFHRYLGSMSNNPDIIGQIADKAVKLANRVADTLTIKYQNRLLIMQNRAKELGINLADLCERDDNGVPTGNIITPPVSVDTDIDAFNAYVNDDPDYEDNPYSVNHGEWEKERDRFKEEKWEEFKTLNPQWETWSGFTLGFEWDTFFRNEFKDWNSQNSVLVEYMDPATGDVTKRVWMPNKKYKTDAWEDLRNKYNKTTSNGDNISKWVRDYIQIKRELDSMLPQNATVSYRLPQFRGTFNDSVKNSSNNQGLWSKAKTSAKNFLRRDIIEKFCLTSLDTDYGDLGTMNDKKQELLGNRLDYERERPSRLPIFGVNKLENMQDMSTDILQSMLAYASMATTYQTLDNIVDSLEVGRSVNLNSRKINPSNKRNEKMGDFIQWAASSTNRVEKTGNTSRIYGRYIKFLDKQVYGISTSNVGFKRGLKKWMLNKIVHNTSALAGAMYLMGNVQGGVVNTLTGFNNIFKEATSCDYYNLKDWAAANKWYFTNWPSTFLQTGSLRKDDKFHLFLDYMDFQGNVKGKFKSWHTQRSGGNNFVRDFGYLPYSAGDHYMQAISLLSVAHGTKMFDTDGNEVKNLWEAYSTVRNEAEEAQGEVYSEGRALQFEKLCPLDASEITIDALNSKGVYLKKAEKNTDTFKAWLYTNYPQFIDEVYRKNHKDDEIALKDTFYDLSDKARQSFVTDRYRTLTNILLKVEQYLNASSPLISVPVFTVEEEDYLKSKNLGAGQYSDILHNVLEDIYNLIWTLNDEAKFVSKTREINNRLHGIYNEADKTAFHQNWYANAFLSMKGWALGNIEMIYSNNHHSIALDRYVEGFATTAGKIAWDALFGAKTNNKISKTDWLLSMINPWSKRVEKAMRKAGYSEEQHKNARRMAISSYLMVLLWALRLATAPGDDDDDEDNSNAFAGTVYYYSMRALLEQEALSPLIPIEMYNNAGQLGDLTPTGFSAVIDLVKLGYQGVGATIADKDNSNFFYLSDSSDGRYEEGDTKAYNHMVRLTPYWKSLWNLQHPYAAAENYDFGRKMRTK